MQNRAIAEESRIDGGGRMPPTQMRFPIQRPLPRRRISIATYRRPMAWPSRRNRSRRIRAPATG
jgi:hypothetical protein